MNEDTFIKLFRSCINHRYFANVNLWHFYQYCILKARRFDYVEMVGNQNIPLEKGQFIFGRFVASKETGLTEQQIRTCLSRLERDGKITVKSTNKFSIITVIKYDSWQTSNQQINQQLTNKQPTDNQQITTIKKEKKEKNTSTPYEEIVSLYHNHCVSLPRVKVLTDSRRKKIASRWEQHKQDFDLFEKGFQSAAESPFLQGQNDRGWKADFDWLMDNDTNLVKVIEGKYNNKQQSSMAGVR